MKTRALLVGAGLATFGGLALYDYNSPDSRRARELHDVEKLKPDVALPACLPQGPLAKPFAVAATAEALPPNSFENDARKRGTIKHDCIRRAAQHRIGDKLGGVRQGIGPGDQGPHQGSPARAGRPRPLRGGGRGPRRGRHLPLRVPRSELAAALPEECKGRLDLPDGARSREALAGGHGGADEIAGRYATNRWSMHRSSRARKASSAPTNCRPAPGERPRRAASAGSRRWMT